MGLTHDPHDTVQTIRYARADNQALQHEKAYILNYDPPPGVPKSNFVIDYFPGIKIRNLRTAGLSFQTNGITMTELDGCMPREDFDDEAKVEDFYLPQVHAALCRALGADEVYIFDYMIRKRESSFPFQPKGKDKAPQPALSAHIGMSIVLCLSTSTDKVKTTLRMRSREEWRSTSKIARRNSRTATSRSSSKSFSPRPSSCN
jgi:hypothetical protein